MADDQKIVPQTDGGASPTGSTIAPTRTYVPPHKRPDVTSPRGTPTPDIFPPTRSEYARGGTPRRQMPSPTGRSEEVPTWR